ncbi:MAG: PIN domain-containing protein [Meiothermus silvanus]|nr:PIN domain-containing protein [Allomeiothermus silvanus]
MKLLFDTSSLVAAFVQSHPAHTAAWEWLEQTLEGVHDGAVATHTLAELYAVLTRLPLRPAIPPSVALQLIEENLRGFQTIALSVADYRAVLQRLEKLNLVGGAIYDALIAQAALKAKAERLLTLNPSHFLRLGHDVEAVVLLPGKKA